MARDRQHRSRRARGFAMTSQNPSVVHMRKDGRERHHMAREVREAGSSASENHGPHAAEEFVRHLLPAAQASALGLPEGIRRYAPMPIIGGRREPRQFNALKGMFTDTEQAA